MKYAPLDVNRNEIRLIRLKSRSYQPPRNHLSQHPHVVVYCEIEYAFRKRKRVAGAASIYKYVALSYAWGRDTDTRAIGIGDSVLNVSVNLEEALRELRHEKEDMMLWVDQICINQQDEEEKASQVQQMKEIYSEALRVVAWVGPAKDESDLIFKHLKTIGEAASIGGGDFEPESFDDLLQGPFANVLPVLRNPRSLERISKAFDMFCQRSYWRRLWVIQEFAVADDVKVVCGTASISYDHFRRALDCIACALYFLEELGTLGELTHEDKTVAAGLALVKAFTTDRMSFIDGIITRRHTYQNAVPSKNSLFHIVTSSLVLESDLNHPECTDPRDRIFAVLGLADDAFKYDKFPDYTKNCEWVYTEAAKKMLGQGHIDILANCLFPRTTKMPTWVPDWRMMAFAPLFSGKLNPKHGASASKKSFTRQKVEFPDSESLTLKGTLVDTVKAFGSVWSPDWLGTLLDHEHTLKYLSEIQAFCTQSQRIPTENVELETSRIAITDWHPLGDQSEFINPLDSYRRVIFQALGKEEKPKLAEHVYDQDYWYRRVMQFLRACRPFITASGFVGLAPPHIESGDVVCIFVGGTVPYILRREEEGVYSLVGEAFVHGVMYGEWMATKPTIKTITLR